LSVNYKFATLNTCSIASIVAMVFYEKCRFVLPLEALVSIQNASNANDLSTEDHLFIIVTGFRGKA
jgi:hypothetical protein